MQSDGSHAAISRILQQLVSALDASHACFFTLPPFDDYQEWQSPSASIRTANGEPSPVLRKTVASIDWDDAIASGNNVIHSPDCTGQLLLAPVTCQNSCIACLAVEASEAGREWPAAMVDLLVTTALMLGEVLDHHKVLDRLGEVCDRRDLAGKLSNTGMWDWNIIMDTLYWSDTVAPLFGLPEDTKPSYEEFLQSVHPEDRSRVEEAVRLSIEEDVPYCCEHRIVRPDGEIRWMLETGGVIRDEDGLAYRMVGVVQDITPRRMTEQALENSQQLLQQFAESIRDVVFIRDIHPSRTVFVNSAYESLWGDSISALYKDPLRFLKFVHPDDLPDVRENMARLEQGIAVRHEYRLVRLDGSERWVRVDAFPIRDEEGKVFRAAGLVEDITEQRNKELHRQHRESQQREALVREVHHRIKNNLQGILGLLRQELGGNPALENIMENTISKVRSIAIIHGIQSRGAHGEIYLCEIVEAIVHAVRDVRGKRIDLELEARVDPPLKILQEEAIPVALILNELLTNAIKHARYGENDTNTCVEFTTRHDRGVIRISNSAPVTLNKPDLTSGTGTGTGLKLVHSLLPHEGATLEIHYTETSNRVEATLELTAPVVMAPDQIDRLPVFGAMEMTV